MNRERRKQILRYIERLKELKPRIKDVTWRSNQSEILANLHRDVEYNYRSVHRYILEELRCISRIPNGLADKNQRFMTEHLSKLKSANEELTDICDILEKYRIAGFVDEWMINTLLERFTNAIENLENAIIDPKDRWSKEFEQKKDIGNSI